MSSGPVGAATALTIVAAFACVTRSGMPAYALRAKKVSSPAASRPPSATLRVSPSMIASARPRAVATAVALVAPFRSASAAERSSSGLAGEPSLPTGASTASGSPRHVFCARVWHSVPWSNAPNAGAAAPIETATASAPVARARNLKCAMPMPPEFTPSVGHSSWTRGPPPRSYTPRRMMRCRGGPHMGEKCGKQCGFAHLLHVRARHPVRGGRARRGSGRGAAADPLPAAHRRAAGAVGDGETAGARADEPALAASERDARGAGAADLHRRERRHDGAAATGASGLAQRELGVARGGGRVKANDRGAAAEREARARAGGGDLHARRADLDARHARRPGDRDRGGGGRRDGGDVPADRRARVAGLIGRAHRDR